METLLFLTGGILLGFLLRNKQKLSPFIEKSITFMIWVLLLLIGITVGVNKEIVENIHVIGGKALLLAGGGIVGSIACSYFVYHKYFKK